MSIRIPYSSQAGIQTAQGSGQTAPYRGAGDFSGARAGDGLFRMASGLKQMSDTLERIDLRNDQTLYMERVNEINEARKNMEIAWSQYKGINGAQAVTDATKLWEDLKNKPPEFKTRAVFEEYNNFFAANSQNDIARAQVYAQREEDSYREATLKQYLQTSINSVGLPGISLDGQLRNIANSVRATYPGENKEAEIQRLQADAVQNHMQAAIDRGDFREINSLQGQYATLFDEGQRQRIRAVAKNELLKRLDDMFISDIEGGNKFFGDLRDLMSGKPIEGSSASPIAGKFRISSPFGLRTPPTPGASSDHKGIDIAVPIGTPVAATGDGIVVRAAFRGNAGNMLTIQHNDGKYETINMHLSRFADGIQPGTPVKAGQIVAYSGNTGKSTGPHLHFEVKENGQNIDPEQYIKSGGGNMQSNFAYAALSLLDSKDLQAIESRFNSRKASAKASLEAKADLNNKGIRLNGVAQPGFDYEVENALNIGLIDKTEYDVINAEKNVSLVMHKAFNSDSGLPANINSIANEVLGPLAQAAKLNEGEAATPEKIAANAALMKASEEINAKRKALQDNPLEYIQSFVSKKIEIMQQQGLPEDKIPEAMLTARLESAFASGYIGSPQSFKLLSDEEKTNIKTQYLNEMRPERRKEFLQQLKNQYGQHWPKVFGELSLGGGALINMYAPDDSNSLFKKVALDVDSKKLDDYKEIDTNIKKDVVNIIKKISTDPESASIFTVFDGLKSNFLDNADSTSYDMLTETAQKMIYEFIERRGMTPEEATKSVLEFINSSYDTIVDSELGYVVRDKNSPIAPGTVLTAMMTIKEGLGKGFYNNRGDQGFFVNNGDNGIVVQFPGEAALTADYSDPNNPATIALAFSEEDILYLGGPITKEETNSLRVKNVSSTSYRFSPGVLTTDPPLTSYAYNVDPTIALQRVQGLRQKRFKELLDRKVEEARARQKKGISDINQMALINALGG